MAVLPSTGTATTKRGRAKKTEAKVVANCILINLNARRIGKGVMVVVVVAVARCPCCGVGLPVGKE